MNEKGGSRPTGNKVSCCCGWGDACEAIQNRVLALPTGSGCDLWKKAHLKIEKGLSEKSKKTIENM